MERELGLDSESSSDEYEYFDEYIPGMSNIGIELSSKDSEERDEVHSMDID